MQNMLHNELLSAMNLTNLHQFLTSIWAVKSNWKNIENTNRIKEKIKGLLFEIFKVVDF